MSQFIKLPKGVTESLKSGMHTPKELADYLIKNYNVYDIAMALADIMIDDACAGDTKLEPIPITEEQFNAHFRLLGKKMVDGEWVEEKRGRRKGTKVIDGKVVINDEGAE